jgi:hypothetical protein
MMTPEQRYFFDLTGYLHLEGVLQGDELKQAQQAAQRYIDTPPDQLAPGFEINQEREHFHWYLHAFGFDKALEALTVHPQTWPILKELSGGKPRLTGGNMMVDFHGKPFHPLHSGREGAQMKGRHDARHYFVKDGKIYCNDLVFFFYLTDVYPGDGGLIVVPCSQKQNFPRLREYFYPGSYTEDGDYNDAYVSTEVPPGVVNFSPKAGDVVIISELLTHGALTWRPKDRDRRFLTLRYSLQHIASGGPLPDGVKAQLSPETLELIAVKSFDETKSIVEQDTVTLS